jgi:hypothetical protein
MNKLAKQLRFIQGMSARADGAARLPPTDTFGQTLEGGDYWLRGYDYMNGKVDAILGQASANMDALPIEGEPETPPVSRDGQSGTV